MIGLDTSHVVAFTQVLNDPDNKAHVPGARVVAAFKGGSPDIAASRDRVDKFTRELQENHGVRIVDSIEELCTMVDAVMLESVDGRPHLAQARPVIKAGKPIYIDKPMAASLKDVLEIFRLAREAKVPVFSSSSLRFGKATQEVRSGSIGKVLGAETFSPVHVEPTHPELFWYGVHGIEALFTVMGPGCVTVRRATTADGRVEVTGTWHDGRIGVFRQAKDNKGYGGRARGERGDAAAGAYDGYAPLVTEIVKFFLTGVPPVPERETIEIFAFMEASDESKRLDGKPVEIAEVIRKCGVDLGGGPQFPDEKNLIGP
jgi:predicted dehydrogenase